jgi:hypothetical protein
MLQDYYQNVSLEFANIRDFTPTTLAIAALAAVPSGVNCELRIAICDLRM